MTSDGRTDGRDHRKIIPNKSCQGVVFNASEKKQQHDNTAPNVCQNRRPCQTKTIAITVTPAQLKIQHLGISCGNRAVCLKDELL